MFKVGDIVKLVGSCDPHPRRVYLFDEPRTVGCPHGTLAVVVNVRPDADDGYDVLFLNGPARGRRANGFEDGAFELAPGHKLTDAQRRKVVTFKILEAAGV